MNPAFKLCAAAIFVTLSASWVSASEIAVLRNGSTIRGERHEPLNGVTRLYFVQSPNSYVDIPSEEILRFEADDMPPASRQAQAVVVSAIVADATEISTLGEAVNVASVKNNIDPHLILSVIRAESAFQPHAISAKGARGLMQLMPETASQLGVQNAFDPIANVQGGTLYLRQLLDRYDNDLIKALAAYNAGPERVDQYRGVPPFAETRAYVARIIRDFNRQKLATGSEAKAAVRPVRSASTNSAPLRPEVTTGQ